MARTTPEQVRATFDANFQSETGDPDHISRAAVEQWIDMASDLVDEVEAADPSLDDSKLTNIETLVAQHYLAAQAQRAESQSGAERSVDYQGETGMGLRGTKYGQNAINLDPTGVLATAGDGQDVSFQVY